MLQIQKLYFAVMFYFNSSDFKIKINVQTWPTLIFKEMGQGNFDGEGNNTFYQHFIDDGFGDWAWSEKELKKFHILCHNHP